MDSVSVRLCEIKQNYPNEDYPSEILLEVKKLNRSLRNIDNNMLNLNLSALTVPIFTYKKRFQPHDTSSNVNVATSKFLNKVSGQS